MGKNYSMPLDMVMLLRDLAQNEIGKLEDLEYDSEQEEQDIDNNISILSHFLDLTEE